MRYEVECAARLQDLGEVTADAFHDKARPLIEAIADGTTYLGAHDAVAIVAIAHVDARSADVATASVTNALEQAGAAVGLSHVRWVSEVSTDPAPGNG